MENVFSAFNCIVSSFKFFKGRQYILIYNGILSLLLLLDFEYTAFSVDRCVYIGLPKIL